MPLQSEDEPHDVVLLCAQYMSQYSVTSKDLARMSRPTNESAQQLCRFMFFALFRYHSIAI
jgi:hypothetical protein